jgi:hypothetical protein
MAKLEYKKYYLVNRKFTKDWASRMLTRGDSPDKWCFESIIEYIESLHDEIDNLNKKIYQNSQ